ncbi:MAG: HAMP domain-containing protein [Wenzhouxiangellaceae bacterium]|nr:HAMP domain-containing protein [Wenzhouxiangellaceae bacterium]
MADRSLLSRFFRILPLAAVAGLLLVALFLVASVEQESSRLGSMSLTILLLTGVALLVLLFAIGQRLVRLVRDLRAQAPGARLRARLVAVFIGLALPPVVVVYLFSMEFLGNTIEGWFDTGAEPALADSIELGQMFLDLRTRQARNQMSRIATGMPARADDDELLDYLFARISSSGPVELTMLSPSGRVENLVHLDPQRMISDLPSAFALNQAARGDEYSAAEAGDRGLRIRVLVPVQTIPGRPPERILQGIFPLPENFSELATSIERAYFRYENVAFLRDRLQQSFILILSLVLGVTALLAILLAFNAARRLVRPIRDLAQATELMRAGEFPETLDVASRDELGFLVESFNSMARQLGQTQQQLESQRHYLETLLGRLSAGVIAFDSRGRLSAANQSASSILGVPLDPMQGMDIEQLRDRLPELGELFQVIARRIEEPADLWRQEVKLERAHQALALVCRGSTLPDSDAPERTGHVVVFDDVTMLDQAQRQAAWAELARRLAHEVKNPLTPIRLAAERLQLRLGDDPDPARAQLVERATGTIINQVDSLRRLVDAFGDYSRPGHDRREALDITPLINGVVDLWSAGDTGVRFELDLDHGNAQPVGDPGQIQQVLNNLVQNAREAHPEHAPLLRVGSRIQPGDEDHDWLELSIVDDGPGFDAEILPRAFDPYASTKPRGTGLGLAIVQRIIDQMGGRIEASNAPGGGARIRLLLPLRP